MSSYKDKTGDSARDTNMIPLKLTQLQRDSLLEMAPLEVRLFKKLEQAGEGTQLMLFDQNELSILQDAAEQAAAYSRSPHKARLMSVVQRLADIYDKELEELERFEPVYDLESFSDLPQQFMYRFKIMLLGINPSIWRRIVVPDCTLSTFHNIILCAMGWEGGHLYSFEIDQKKFTEPKAIDGLNYFDAKKNRLSEFLLHRSKPYRFKYLYDFGDCWQHNITFEGVRAVYENEYYSQCLGGERACPPEDCGGVGGYYKLLQELLDPEVDENLDRLDCTDDVYDPEAFDASSVTAKLRKLKIK